MRLRVRLPVVMKIGVATEQFPGERRVALVPASIAALKKAGLGVPLIQTRIGRLLAWPRLSISTDKPTFSGTARNT